MGSTATPEFQQINSSPTITGGQTNFKGYDDLETKLSGLFPIAQNKMNEGLSDAERQLREKQGLGAITGNVNTAMSKLGQNPNLTTGAKLGFGADLYKGAGSQQQSMLDSILQADLQEKDKGFGMYSNLVNSLSGLRGQGNALVQNRFGNELNRTNTYNQNMLKQYEINKANEFDWGGMLGSLFGLGGTIGGAMLGLPPGSGNMLAGGLGKGGGG